MQRLHVYRHAVDANVAAGRSANIRSCLAGGVTDPAHPPPPVRPPNPPTGRGATTWLASTSTTPPGGPAPAACRISRSGGRSASAGAISRRIWPSVVAPSSTLGSEHARSLRGRGRRGRRFAARLARACRAALDRRSAPTIGNDRSAGADDRTPAYVSGSCIGRASAGPQHFLYLRPEPHQHGSLRPGGHAMTPPSVVRWTA